MMDSPGEASDYELKLFDSDEHTSDEVITKKATTSGRPKKEISVLATSANKMQVELDMNTMSVDNDLNGRTHIIEEAFQSKGFNSCEEFDLSLVTTKMSNNGRISTLTGECSDNYVSCLWSS